MVAHMTTRNGRAEKTPKFTAKSGFLSLPLSSLGHRFEESKSHLCMVVGGRAPGNGGNGKERSS